MKFLSLMAVIVMSVAAQAHHSKSRTLVCQMGDAADMDIKIEPIDEKTGGEKLSVVLMMPDGDTTHTFVNSHFVYDSLSKGLAEGKLDALVSKSDLEEQFGGAFIDAGMLTLQYNERSKKYDVIFAAQGVVYTAACAD